MPRPKRGRPSHKNKPKSADDIPRPPKFEEIVSEMKDEQSKQHANTPTPGLFNFSSIVLSPFTSLKSRFGPIFSLYKEMTDFTAWSLLADTKEIPNLSY